MTVNRPKLGVRLKLQEQLTTKCERKVVGVREEASMGGVGRLLTAVSRVDKIVTLTPITAFQGQ